MSKEDIFSYKPIEQELVVVDAERINSKDTDETFDPYKPEDEEWDNSSNGSSKDNVITKGAAALCGLTGCLIGGPFLAILAAIGGAYAAAHNRGPVGDASRAFGDVALAAGNKAREVGVYQKSGMAFTSVCRGVRNSIGGRSNSNTRSDDA